MTGAAWLSGWWLWCLAKVGTADDEVESLGEDPVGVAVAADGEGGVDEPVGGVGRQRTADPDQPLAVCLVRVSGAGPEAGHLGHDASEGERGDGA